MIYIWKREQKIERERETQRNIEKLRERKRERDRERRYTIKSVYVYENGWEWDAVKGVGKDNPC